MTDATNTVWDMVLMRDPSGLSTYTGMKDLNTLNLMNKYWRYDDPNWT
jgi:hypothetical protein